MLLTIETKGRINKLMNGDLKFFPCACCGYPVPISKATDSKHIFCTASCSRELWKKYKKEWMWEDSQRGIFENCCRSYFHKIQDFHRGSHYKAGSFEDGFLTQKATAGAEISWHDRMPSIWEKYFREIDSARAESKRAPRTTDTTRKCG